ncbi:MAG: hypothetical protein SPG98_01320 [Porcincola intestinalis]|uniref:hypothetical protein n=1 Tax=Porcincola intestinalis TaxID=2606632 RepID=UPI002A90D586|nr:hypothetical protein [Porcincola intestinalis]MDY5331393.1 hypothetical protein [Porcincola intestinalis]
MTNIGGLILQAFMMTVYFLLFKTDIWGKVSPYLAGIICGYFTFAYIQDFHPGVLKHPHVAVWIFIAVFELLTFLLLRNAQLRIPGTFLCLSINIMLLMVASAGTIKRASVAHCTIAILIYFLIAGTIIRLSTSDDFGNDLTGEVRTRWPMRVLAATINAVASIIYCADPLFILSAYCTKYCTESQQDKLNIAAWIGVIGMMGGTFAWSLIRDYLLCKRIFRGKTEKSPGRRPFADWQEI